MIKRTTSLAALALLGTLVLAGCSTGVTSTPPKGDSASNSASEAPAEKPAEVEAKGTRESPFPLGTTVSSKDWDVVINSVTLAANEEVAAANGGNPAPVDGNEWIVINYTTTYIGDDADGAMPAFVSIEYVTPEGNTVTGLEAIAIAPEPRFDITNALYNGASASGNKVLSVPSATADAGVLAVRAGMLADKVFIAVK